MAFVKPPARNMPPGSEPWAQWVEEQMSSVTKQTVAVSQYAERAAGGVNSALEGNIQNRDEINRVFEATENSMQLADGAIVWSKVDPDPNEVPANTNVIWYTYDPVTREVLRMWQWGYYDADAGEYREAWYQAQLGADSIHDEAITSAKVALGAIDWDQIGPGVTATVEGAVSELETLNDTTLPALNTQIAEAQTALTATDNKVNTLQNTTIPNLQTALSNVEGVAQSADKRSTVSTAAPSATTGFPQNAAWQRINASGAVIGSWRLSGSSWVQMPLDPVVIPNLSAGIITSGVLNTNRLNASEVAAATGEFLSLSAGQITSGTLDTNRLNATAVAAAVGSFLSLSAGQITSGTIDTGRLNAQEIAAASGQFLSLSAGQITSGTLDTGRLNATSVAAAVANVIELNASRITAGTLSADRIAANSIVGDKIVSNAITARELAVGAITADKAVIANSAIKSAMIAEANILTAHIDNLAVTNAKIANTTITDAKILNLDAGKITTGFLDAARIQANSIVTSKLAATAIDGMTITGSTIQTSSASNSGVKIDTANGLRAWDSEGNLSVQISPSIKNAIAVRNPTGQLVPLSDAVFGIGVLTIPNFSQSPATSGNGANQWSQWWVRGTSEEFSLNQGRLFLQGGMTFFSTFGDVWVELEIGLINASDEAVPNGSITLKADSSGRSYSSGACQYGKIVTVPSTGVYRLRAWSRVWATISASHTAEVSFASAFSIPR